MPTFRWVGNSHTVASDSDSTLDASGHRRAVLQFRARRRLHISGRVMRRSRRLIIRLADGHPGLNLVLAARRTILALARGPT